MQELRLHESLALSRSKSLEPGRRDAGSRALQDRQAIRPSQRKGLALARLIIFGEPGDPRQWVTCANEITARIADGRYPHGQWLPPLAKISADLGAENSYYPIRQALRQIRDQELISFAEHTGYYVGDTEPEDKPQADLRHYAIPRTPAAAPANKPDRLLTPAEAAAMFRVDPATVTRWADAGKLSSTRTLGGHRRFYASEVEKYLRDSRRKGRKG
jgi:excisionase family DNA binding protein